MPRRRQRRRAAPPPNVKPHFQLPPQPNFKELKVALSGVVSAAIESRIQALTEVANWYGNAADYLIQKAQVDQKVGQDILQKLAILTKANKLRELGINPAALHPERELALRRSIEQYEQYVGSHIKGLPLPLKPIYEQYEAKRVRLEAKEKEMADRFAVLVNTLTNIFPDLPLKFKVSPTVEGRRFDPGVVAYGKDAAREMLGVLKNEGVLKVFSNEVVQIAKFNATVPNGQGAFVIDPKKWVSNIDDMFKKFVAYCQSENGPAKVIRKGAAVPVGVNAGPTIVQPKQPQAPRAPRPAFNNAGPKVAGRWNQGSAIAVAYEALAKGNEYTKEELQALSGAKWIINHLVKEAKKYGDFKIEQQGGKFKMSGGPSI